MQIFETFRHPLETFCDPLGVANPRLKTHELEVSKIANLHNFVGKMWEIYPCCTLIPNSDKIASIKDMIYFGNQKVS